MHSPRPWATLALTVLMLPAVAGAQETAEIDIPYERFVLPNGLTLVVHEDPKAPVVAVNVWYHVGSKNEPAGKSGFAHLFEHLMFNGSENYDDDYFKAFDRIGATGMNGTTNEDRTNYFEVVPTTALDVALWMESDRMGHLLGAVDQARLDEQRGVVQNEKRQGENQPYGKVYDRMTPSLYPPGHPYHHTVIGSMEDLEAAALEDVHEWFRSYYGAANATLVVAGDVVAEEVHQKVLRAFGDIPSGPPVPRHRAWIAKRSGSQRDHLQDRVPQARIYRVWNVPPVTWAATDHLELLGAVLGDGKTSRLYRRLVHEDQTATQVSARIWPGEIGSVFVITATAQPGGDLAAVEAAIDEELQRLLEEGPAPDEVARVQTEYRAALVRGIERVGGFGGKSDQLARGQVFYGDPGAWRTVLERVETATPESLQEAGRAWLRDGDYNLVVEPFPEFTTTGSDVDRSAVPEVREFPEPGFTSFERATLDNGLEILVAQRDAVPLVLFDLVVDAGYAADRSDAPGVASMALEMLDEGAGERSSLEISEALARLGAQLSTGSTVDTSHVRLNALRDRLPEALDLFADVVLQPSFPDPELERLRRQRLATIAQEKAQPMAIGLRVLPRLLYGPGHPYGQPLTGSGTPASVEAMSREDLSGFHATWFRPGNATLVVVGDIALDDLRPLLEERFGAWSDAPVPVKDLSVEAAPAAGGVYLIDRPGADQSMIFAARRIAARDNPEEVALQAANDVLGGSFTSRINMNLREDKHWSYGAGSMVVDARGPRPWFVRAPVQTDRTAESLAEVDRELREFAGERPPSTDEVAKVQDQSTLTLPGRWETNAAVRGALVELVRFDLDDDYWSEYPREVRELDRDQVVAAARELADLEDLVWLVVGDRARIEEGVRALELGPLHLLDADGAALP